jgi:hypothetical protein
VRGLRGGEQRYLLVRCRRHGNIAVRGVAEEGLDVIARAVLLIGCS